MRGRIDIVVVAYALSEDLARLYDSIHTQQYGRDVYWQIYIHSRRHDVLRVCDQIASSNQRVKLWPFGINRGLARSWNDGWKAAKAAGSEFVFIANDDARAAPGDLAKLLAAGANAEDDVYMVSGRGWDQRNQEERDQLFSLALLTDTALNRVGMFDVNFWPIYWEDIDWYRRAHLLGLRRRCVDDTNIFHAGSKTYLTEQNHAEHNQTFHTNRAYYEHKWGGPMGHEQYARPFNRPELSLFIHPDDAEKPYPLVQNPFAKT